MNTVSGLLYKHFFFFFLLKAKEAKVFGPLDIVDSCSAVDSRTSLNNLKTNFSLHRDKSKKTVQWDQPWLCCSDHFRSGNFTEH